MSASQVGTLPVARQARTAGQRPDPAARGHVPRRATVLVVSEDGATRDQIGSILREQGYRVLDARHGGHALLMCLSHQEPIDLLVTEERTPETDGRRLARTLSRIRPQLKALFLSAPPPGIEAPLLQNTSPVLQQPFTAASLHAEVEAVLENGGPNN